MRPFSVPFATRLAMRPTSGRRASGCPVRTADGGSFVIHVLPLGHGEMRRGIGQRASVALFIAPTAASRRTPTDALTLLYDLDSG